MLSVNVWPTVKGHNLAIKASYIFDLHFLLLIGTICDKRTKDVPGTWLQVSLINVLSQMQLSYMNPQTKWSNLNMFTAGVRVNKKPEKTAERCFTATSTALVLSESDVPPMIDFLCRFLYYCSRISLCIIYSHHCWLNQRGLTQLVQRLFAIRL